MSSAAAATPALRLTVWGACRTKKNHGTVIQRGKHRFHIPSAAWTEWVRTANIEVANPADALAHLPVEVPVNCRAIFYRDAHRGDAVGYYQGLADLLEKRKIVVNDVLIVSWDGSRLLKDADNPRVEIELSPARDVGNSALTPGEEQRALGLLPNLAGDREYAARTRRR